MNKLIIITLTLVCFLPVACTDLDLQPRSTTTPEVLFKDETSYRAFIAKAYAGLATTGQSGPAGSADISGIDEGFSNYIRVYWKLQELTTEEAVISWGDEGIQDLHNQTWTAANQYISATYYRVFYQISLANEFLRETTDAKLGSRNVSAPVRADIVKYRAEARFLRALSYWHAIDMFGNVPFYTEEDALGAETPRRGTREEVFNFIDQELQSIENVLPAPGQGEYARADRAAVWMLQAHLYLNAQVYTGKDRNSDCVTACKKVIDSDAYTLEDDWRNLFKADNNLSKEIIFAVAFDGLHTQTYGGTTFLVHAGLGGKMVDNKDDQSGADYPNKDEAMLRYGVNGGWSGLRTTSTFVDLFQGTSGADERANFYTDGQSKDIANISDFSNGYAVQKYTNLTSNGDPGSDVNFADTDYPMFRLADAYLMYAEAVLRGGSGGDATTALGYINLLRERAYNGTTGDITAGQLNLDFILDERGRELYWEAFRRTDLIRYGKFSTGGIWPFKGGVPEGKTTEAFRNLFPLPSGELSANPNLTQNDGY